MIMKALQSVLLVTPWYRPCVGGVVETVARLAEGLAEEGIETHVLVQGDYEVITRISAADGVTVWALNLRTVQSTHPRLRLAGGYMAHFRATRRQLQDFIRHHNVQIVNIHYPGSEFSYFALWPRPREFKLVVSVHGSDIRLEIHQGWLHGLLTRRLLLAADAVVACSQSLLKMTQEELNDHLEGRGRVIYGGVLEDWIEEGNVSGESRDPNSILLVGSLRDVKGIDIALKAFASLRHQHAEAKLAIAGDGPLKAELLALAEELGISKQVSFLGSVPQDELRGLYRRTGLVIMPSRSEGFGLVALEALASGTAIIAAAVGGLPELITDRENGMLIPAEDIEALAKGMKYLLEHPEEARLFGQRGRQLVAERYTWRHNRKAYLELYARLLAHE